MKIAGRKNDGAWYRTNKVISGLNQDEKNALQALIIAIPSIDAAYAAMAEIAVAAGLDGSGDLPDNANAWSITLANSGIPRQVWMGVLSWDTYTRSQNQAGDQIYTPDHAVAVRAFAQDLRAVMKRFVFGRRQLLDLANAFPRDAGNPGGIADAVRGN